MRSVLLLSFALLPTAALAQARTISTVAPETTMTAAMSGSAAATGAGVVKTRVPAGRIVETIRASVNAVQLDMSDGVNGVTFGAPNAKTDPKLVHYSNIPVSMADLVDAPRKTTVQLSVLVDRTGTPLNLHIDRSAGNTIDAEVLSAVKNFRFQPGTEEYVPVEKEITLTVTLDKK